MNDQTRLYGTRSEFTGHVNFPFNATEQEVRDYSADQTGVTPVSVLVSAIEPLPAPRPALPTTPGSVVRVRNEFILRTHDGDYPWVGEDSNYWSNSDIDGMDWTLVFDSGAHDKGKTND